eukprot:80608_1
MVPKHPPNPPNRLKINLLQQRVLQGPTAVFVQYNHMICLCFCLLSHANHHLNQYFRRKIFSKTLCKPQQISPIFNPQLRARIAWFMLLLLQSFSSSLLFVSLTLGACVVFYFHS